MRATALAGGLFFLCALAIGCGDDEGGSDGGDAGDGAGSGGMGGASGGMGGAGGRPPLPELDGGAGNDAAVGDLVEGAPCLTTAECEDGLACVESGFANFGVCARSCASDDDCGGETCVSISGAPADAHCINLINEEFELCGVIDTSNCAPAAGLTCLYLPDVPYGVCTTLCSSGGDDAGAPNDACDADQFCRGGIVSTNQPGQEDGICGAHASRGETCGIFEGAFCDPGDVCAPASLPVTDDTEFVCRQDCTEDPDSCADGTTCTMHQGFFFCM